MSAAEPLGRRAYQTRADFQGYQYPKLKRMFDEEWYKNHTKNWEHLKPSEVRKILDRDSFANLNLMITFQEMQGEYPGASYRRYYLPNMNVVRAINRWGYYDDRCQELEDLFDQGWKMVFSCIDWRNTLPIEIFEHLQQNDLKELFQLWIEYRKSDALRLSSERAMMTSPSLPAE